MYIWEIEAARYQHIDNSERLMFTTREKAEAHAAPIALKMHEDAINSFAEGYDDEDDMSNHDEETKAWWRSRPPLNTFRTDAKTIYSCGEPYWDAQDGRAACYLFVCRRLVIE